MSYIDASGKYHSENMSVNDILPTKTSVWKQSSHDHQRQEHKRDLIRPWLPNGDMNPDFLEQYPDEAEASYNFNPNANLELSKE